MDSFCRMKKKGRGAGAGQSCRYLAADDARLAHAGDDDSAAAIEQDPDCFLEAVVESIHQGEDGRRFCLQHFFRECEIWRDYWADRH